MTALEIKSKLENMAMLGEDRAILEVAYQLACLAADQVSILDALRDTYFQIKRVGDATERIATALEKKGAP